ncbi:MAG: hypothetical protein EOM80_19585 [Erysipelotrichia bacterium]|nr:hypothetical protein [Erysipelotrichia bacterium]
MKPTKGRWSVSVKEIENNLMPSYFEISSGDGFYNLTSEKGFGITGYMAPDDAALIGNAKAMYDILNRFAKNTSEYRDFEAESQGVLNKIEKTFQRLEKENAKAKKANK